MSSILKALKKLEEEKLSRRDGAINLADDILREPTARTAKRGWQLPATAVILLFLVLMVIYLLSRSNTVVVTKTSPAMTSAPPAAKESANPVKVVAPGVTTIIMPAKKKPSLPSADAPRQTLPPQPAQKRVLQLPESTVVKQEAPAPLPVKPVPLEVEKKAATSSVPPGPNFEVSGIAWQKDNAARLAIINGHPAGTGTVIDGATIEEILQDRVRFSFNKKSFDVLLGKSGRPN